MEAAYRIALAFTCGWAFGFAAGFGWHAFKAIREARKDA